MVATARVRFRLWDGVESGTRQLCYALVGTIVFRNRRALLSWLWDPDLYFGETYMFGAADVRGDLTAVLMEIYRALGRETRRSWWLWQRSNDEHAARENVHRHYDLGNAFYQRWLDREMAYTCAYFPTPEATLEDSQIAKMDRVCRKLALQPGDRVLEAGAVGRACPVHGPPLWRDRSRNERLGRADRVRARSGAIRATR
jgi:cyclopropane-fatty-acyl-phospholipid synthase